MILHPLATNIFDLLGSPVEWGLVHLERAFATFPPTRAVGALGLAIIAVTLIIRGALFPVFGWQLRTMAKTQAEQRTIAPQLKALRQRHRKEPQKLSAEMQKLYKEHGINPFSGCLGCVPLIIQLPVLFALYNGIRLATGSIHQDLGFLWISNVSQTLRDACCQSDGLGGLLIHPHLAILPGLAMGLTYVQARMMTPPVHEGMTEQERKTADISRMFVFIGPVMVGFFSYTFYQGITLYWATQSAFMVAQQYYVRGWGSMPVPAWLPGANRVTPLSFKRPEPKGGGKAKAAADHASRRGAGTGGGAGGRRGAGSGGRRGGGGGPQRESGGGGGQRGGGGGQRGGDGDARHGAGIGGRSDPAGSEPGGSPVDDGNAAGANGQGRNRPAHPAPPGGQQPRPNRNRNRNRRRRRR